MIVDLSYFPDLGLIIKKTTGVRYTNQTAGFACEHPEEEGFFVPLATQIGRPELATLQGLFRGAWNPLTNTEAKQLQSALNRHGLSSIKVDESMLSESKEAWVHIIVNATNAEAVPINLELSQSAKGILIWPNSD